MQAIVSALDDPHREMVENIWGELKAVFGLQGVIGSTSPHITWHVAEHYDEARIGNVLERIVRTTGRVEVETHGLGVFSSTERILYLHVTKTPQIAAMHAAVWHGLASIASGIKPVYAAETWLPHISFAVGEIADEQLAVVLRFLGRRDHRWRFAITNLSLITGDDAPRSTWRRFEVRS